MTKQHKQKPSVPQWDGHCKPLTCSDLSLDQEKTAAEYDAALGGLLHLLSADTTKVDTASHPLLNRAPHDRSPITRPCLHCKNEVTKARMPKARAREVDILPLSAHATSGRMRISVAPVSSTRPISVYVVGPDGTGWRVGTITIDGIARRYGTPPYLDCPGNCWIDLEVECPHDPSPTEANPTKLLGRIVCEASSLPPSTGDTERNRQWPQGTGKFWGAQRMPNDAWKTTYRGDFAPSDLASGA